MVEKINRSIIYQGLNGRVFADFDNERVYDLDIVGLSKSNEIIDFEENIVILKENEFIYLFMQIDIENHVYVVAEGFVIPNPYAFKPYLWCCKLVSEIEYFEDYNRRFGKG